MAETIHNHVSPPYKLNFWMGNLIFRDSWQFHAQVKIPVSDPGQQGHLNNKNGQTVIIPPGAAGRDELQPGYSLEAEAQKPTLDSGQQGRSLRDTSRVITRPIESPTTSDSTAALWNRGKVFAGKIKF